MRKSKILKIVSVLLIISMVNSLFLPTVSYALTAGPGSPEFSSFEPVATTDMVDVFTGDFTYNLPVVEIPGPDGGGYALSLSYHGGASSEEEASWVGYGWTLNPGAINRNVKGFPDDYDHTPVNYYNKTRPNWTIATRHKLNLEFFSKEQNPKGSTSKETKYKPGTFMPSLEFGTSLRFNNYQGFARGYSLGASFGGMVSLGMQYGAGGITFSADINPLNILNKFVIQKKIQEKVKELKDRNCPEDQGKLDKLGDLKKFADHYASQGSSYGLTTFAMETTSMSVADCHGYNLNFSLDASARASICPIGLDLGVSGSFSMQYNIPAGPKYAFGYMNTPDSPQPDEMQDYYTEKSQPFDKRDYFLGIPFSNADNFMLTGEGLSGGFRIYNKRIGTYHPNRSETNLKIFNVGFQVSGIVNLGVGLTFGFGVQKTIMEDWKRKENMDEFAFDHSNPIFHFKGDLGGKLEYGNNGIESLVTVEKSPNFPGIGSGKVTINTNNVFTTPVNQVGSSSYIERYPASGMLEGFDIYNADGTKYRYGATSNGPTNTFTLHTKNESNISVDVPNGAPVENNYTVTQTPLSLNHDYILDPCDHQSAVGEIKNEPYANSYLVNEITTYDYIDDGNQEADEGDVGGWTKFEYDKIYGSTTGQWYRWRAPYRGLIYQKNDISDINDDLGSVTTGQKEVAYLSGIKTKTHTAYFITNETTPNDFPSSKFPHSTGIPVGYLTGSATTRLDGLDAAAITGGSDPAANSTTAQGSHKLRKLEKIVLFANNRPDKPIKTIHFEYKNNLVPHLPNNSSNVFDESGKLTLVKVWFDYEGAANAFISPYEFKYQYKPYDDFNEDLATETPQLADFFHLNDNLTSYAQNPEYKPYLLDGWGNNQLRAKERHDDMNPWLYQGDLDATDYFDPAAWQLKQIKLPSGGEILIQYEQKDYQYVQDRRAMVMTSLAAFSDGGTSGIDKFPTYDISLDDIGLPTTGSSVSDYIEQLKKYFKADSNKIYFKFLFALKDQAPGLTDCKSQYIDGYARVSDIYQGNNNTIQIQLDGGGSGYESDGYCMVPRQGCYEFYSTQRVGKYENGCEGKYEQQFDGTAKNIAKEDICNGSYVLDLLHIIDKFVFATEAIVVMEASTLNDLSIQVPRKSEVCLDMNEELSYLKVPLPEGKAKRGGGIRVKRLLMYDPGIEDGDAAIYGSEYKYELEDRTSSGVATTEPSSMREENALVDFLPKKQQSWWNRHIVGADKEQAEGPIGESLLPSASVGHSRIVVQNIHSGKTGTGFTIHQFNTVKEYPFDKDYDYSALDLTDEREFDFAEGGAEKGVSYSNLAEQTKTDALSIPTGFFNYSHKRMWAGQSFRFIINEMNGRPKSVEGFQGEYGTAGYVLVSSTKYAYYEPGEQVRVMTPDGHYAWDNPGKEMEIAMESKNIHDNSLDFELPVDLDVGLTFWPPIFVTFSPNITLSDKTMSTHATSKVIRYPVIVKFVDNYKDGIWSKTENIGFAQATGQVILTRTTDSYHDIPLTSNTVHDGSFYNLKLPAHWYYPFMGQKANSASPSLQGNQLNATAGSIVTYGAGGNPITGGNAWSIPQNNIVNATANTFKATPVWTNDLIDEYNAANFTTDLGNIWRPEASYVFKTDILQSNSSSDKIFNGGVYIPQVFIPFDYQIPGSSISQWIKLNEVTKYSPNGNPVEEKDNLDIYSAAKYGYNFTQATMIAKNAQYSEIQFDDFENDITGTGAPVYSYASNPSHSGDRSVQIMTSPQAIFLPFTSTTHFEEKGAIIKLWAKSSVDLADKLYLSTTGLTQLYPSKMAQTGEWTLFSFKVEPQYMPNSSSVQFSLNIDNVPPDLYIDDIRIQPADAQATCYVYDIGTLRLITQFDDQHFGLYYQYNGEGKLVRKLVETERGLKTIQETQYNKPTTKRINP